MVNLNVVYEAKAYALNDLDIPQYHPVTALTLIQNGLLPIFQAIADEFPGHNITVSWNEDEQRLSYSSDMLEPSVIGDALKKYHGIEL